MHYALYSLMHSKMMWSFSEFKEIRLKDLVFEVPFFQKASLVCIVFLYALKNDGLFKRFTLKDLAFHYSYTVKSRVLMRVTN